MPEKTRADSIVPHRTLGSQRRLVARHDLHFLPAETSTDRESGKEGQMTTGSLGKRPAEKVKSLAFCGLPVYDRKRVYRQPAGPVCFLPKS